jgi:hypothetical protein
MEPDVIVVVLNVVPPFTIVRGHGLDLVITKSKTYD